MAGDFDRYYFQPWYIKVWRSVRCWIKSWYWTIKWTIGWIFKGSPRDSFDVPCDQLTEEERAGEDLMKVINEMPESFIRSRWETMKSFHSVAKGTAQCGIGKYCDTRELLWELRSGKHWHNMYAKDENGKWKQVDGFEVYNSPSGEVP